MIFTRVGFVIAVIGAVLGALMLFQSFTSLTLAMSDFLFRGALPIFSGSVIIGILAEISNSLRKD